MLASRARAGDCGPALTALMLYPGPDSSTRPGEPSSSAALCGTSDACWVLGLGAGSESVCCEASAATASSGAAAAAEAVRAGATATAGNVFPSAGCVAAAVAPGG